MKSRRDKRTVSLLRTEIIFKQEDYLWQIM